MAIWMDMTNSLHTWQGKVVGIVRAELEIAKNMHLKDQSIRFCFFDGYKFLEIDSEELSWLWESQNVGDAYLKTMKREPDEVSIESASQKSEEKDEYPQLKEAYNYSASRLLRLSTGLRLYFQTLPKPIGMPLSCIGRLVVKPLKWMSRKRANYKQKKKDRAMTFTYDKKQKSINKEFSYPFIDGDILFSCGWFTSGKEPALSRIKFELRHFTLIYLVYDIILLLPETKCFYDYQSYNEFKRFFEWISFNCDYIIYGGNTAKMDSQNYQKEHGFPIPKGFPVKFGSDILKISNSNDSIEEIRKAYGIGQKYIIMVGSLDMRKNYNTIYRAYTILIDEHGKETVPDMVIVGRTEGYSDLQYCIKKDPRTKDKIKIISPNNSELDCLYKNCLFSILASSYEGWSLTLPEALGYHKFCIVSDIPPLREVGEDYVEYVDTYDPFAWAEQIWRYCQDNELLSKREKKIKNGWHTVTWEECGIQILDILSSVEKSESAKKNEPMVYLDITTSVWVATYGQKISGIPRAEIMLLHYLYTKFNNIKCFSCNEEYGFQPIYTHQILDILSDKNPTDGFERSRSELSTVNDCSYMEQKKKALPSEKSRAFWLICSILSPKYQKKLIDKGYKKVREIENRNEINIKLPFVKGDLIFSAGTGHSTKIDNMFLSEKKRIGFKVSQLLYDFTPMIIPQTHRPETIKQYIPFVNYSSEISDLIFYGGANAQKDGIKYQKENNLPVPPSIPVKFGGNIAEYEDPTEDEEKNMLKGMTIKGPFILMVGTCEARKNHETIYRAYLRLLAEYDEDDLPQIVFAGNPGWNSGNFFHTMWCDERVKDHIITFSPDDRHLDFLYKRCMFTLLPSLYEGWSLTLPESFQYGKFCLCCDNPALRETGRDLVEYIHPWDEVKWADRIMYYVNNPDKLKAAEKRIHDEWKQISWDDCADSIAEGLKSLMTD